MIFRSSSNMKEVYRPLKNEQSCSHSVLDPMIFRSSSTMKEVDRSLKDEQTCSRSGSYFCVFFPPQILFVSSTLMPPKWM
jgi:hypothetical protein